MYLSLSVYECVRFKVRVHDCLCGCSVDVQRRGSDLGVGEMSAAESEVSLEDQMLQQSGYASHGK